MDSRYKSPFIYNIDERPPLLFTLIYGFQWALIFVPIVMMLATLWAEALNLSYEEKVVFIQLTFIASGFFTFIQTLWGHSYPVIEGPSAAHLLTLISLIPYGISSIQTGMIVGSILMIFLGMVGKIDLLRNIFTRNVVVVILLLITFSLIPSIIGSISSVDRWIFFFGLIVFMTIWNYHFKGMAGTFSLVVGTIVGTLCYPLIGSLDFSLWLTSDWFSFPRPWIGFKLEVSAISIVSFAVSYMVVLVNMLGSLAGIASITDMERFPFSVRKSLIINGISGSVCGMLGINGLVSYSISPGVVTSQRVSSRYVIACCGLIIILIGLIPKVSSLFTLVPPVVVSSVLCVVMGSQVGTAIKMASSGNFDLRDSMVVGISVIVGIVVSLTPEESVRDANYWLRLFLKNSLVSGILFALLMEHILLRKRDKSHEKHSSL